MNKCQVKSSLKKILALSFLGYAAVVSAGTYSELPIENVQVNLYTQVSEDNPLMKIWGDGQNALHPSSEFPPEHQYSYALLKWDLNKLKNSGIILSEITIASAKIKCTTAGIAKAIQGKIPPLEAYLASSSDFDLDSILSEEKTVSDLPKPTNAKLGESQSWITDISKGTTIEVILDSASIQKYLRSQVLESNIFLPIYLTSSIKCEQFKRNHFTIYSKECNDESISPQLIIEY